MHSRIFQVSMEPIPADEYIEESDYYEHWFIGSVADYVSDECDRDEDIAWLQRCVKGISFGEDDNGKYFIVENKEEYFARKFEGFKNALDKIKDCTLADFANGRLDIYSLKSACENKFGFYVDTNDDGLDTFDSFIRYCDLQTKYYIGGTIDYHA